MTKKKAKVGVLLFAITVLFIGCSKVSLNLKTDNVEVEYGKSISLNASDYLNNDEKTLSKVKVKSNIKNEEGKEYPSVGEYPISLIFEDDENTKVDVKVVVKDTMAPTFKDIKDQYEIETGQTLSSEEFKTNVDDLSEVEITIDDTKVDYKVPGTYNVIVKAIDKSGNESTKEITVVIKEKEENLSQEVVENNSNDTSSNSNAGNNSPVTTNPSTSESSSNIGNQSTTPITPVEEPIITTPIEVPKPQVEEKQYNIGNSGMLFDTEEEARNYAEDYLDKNYKEVGGYLLYSTYDKYTINFDYY